MANDNLRLREEFMVKASPAEVWRILSDTDGLNRSIGLPPILFRTSRDEKGARRRYARLGFPGAGIFEYEELPFEWVENEWFSVRRIFPAFSPVREMRLGAELCPGDEGTVARVTADFSVSWPGVGAAVEKVGGSLIRKCREHVERKIAGGDAPVPRRRNINLRLLDERLAGLPSPKGSDLLRHLIISGEDTDLHRLRPFALADSWGLDRADTLRFFLGAIRVGVLDLSWTPVCPHCRGNGPGVGRLREIRPEARCESCSREFGVDFDEALEAVFTVHPEIRRVVVNDYCIGGPGRTRHVHAQFFLAPGEPRQLALALPPGRYRTVARESGKSLPLIISSSEPAEVRLDFSDDGFTGASLSMSPRTLLTAVNRGSRVELIAIEDEAWTDKAASAAMVTSLDEFRRVFPADSLAEDVEIAIRSLTVLFTDLKSSTALYERVGDGPAYELVRGHFEFLFRVIREHDGAVVKTVGDAVMAVFAEGAAAMRAALQLQAEVEDFNASLGERLEGAGVVLKIGLHRGPLLAVNANDVLDYFGATVNTAARVQALSEGGDVVVTTEFAESPEVAAILEASNVRREVWEARLKGVPRPVNVTRCRLSGE